MKTMSNERILKRYGVVDENGNIKNNKVQVINFIYGYGANAIRDGYIGKEFNLVFSNDNLIYYGGKEYFGNGLFLIDPRFSLFENFEYISKAVAGGISTFSFREVENDKFMLRYSYKANKINQIEESDNSIKFIEKSKIITSEKILTKNPEDYWLIQVEFAHYNIPCVKIIKIHNSASIVLDTNLFIPVFTDESELFREYKPSLIYYTEDPENKVICKEVLSVHETGSEIIKF